MEDYFIQCNYVYNESVLSVLNCGFTDYGIFIVECFVFVLLLFMSYYVWTR